MDFKRGVQKVPNIDVEALRREATEAGFLALVLPGTKIVDRATFFEVVKTSLPLDPPIEGTSNWDALSDSLWEGLGTLPAQRLVILWPDADRMVAGEPEEFQVAVEVFADVANLLADAQATQGAPKEVAVVIECHV